jgi:hypothetical protein
LNLKFFKFHKAEGRNNNEVTVVCGLFDRNGNYSQGIEKIVSMRLKDDTLDRLAQSDRRITVRTSFDVKPGTYLIRLVVRDTEERKLSATNGAVAIQ